MPPTETPPAVAPAPVAPTPAAPSNSPKSPVPPLGSAAAHMEAAKKVFSSDPAQAPTPPAEASKPAEPAKPDAPKAPEPVSIIKKPDAAPAPVEFPEDKLPEPKSDEAKAGWKELKNVTKAERNRATVAEARVKELEAKQSAAPAVAADTAELERLRGELKTHSDRLLILDLQNHPDFHKQYVVPEKAALDTVAEVMRYQKEPKDVAALPALLAKPLKDFNAEVSEITKDMNPADASTVMQSLRQARDLHAQKQAALAKAGDVAQQFQARTQQVQRQAFESVASDVVPNFIKQELRPDMSAEEKASVDAYNKSIEGLKGRAEARVFGKVGEKDVATMAFKEAALDHLVTHAVPYLERHVASQNQTIAALNAELKALRGGKNPPPGGGDTPPAAPAGETIEQSAKRVWRGGT